MNNEEPVESTDAEKAADIAIWSEGHDARLKGRYINPYDPFNQRNKFASWLSGFQAAQLSLKMDEQLRPVTDAKLEEIFNETWVQMPDAARKPPLPVPPLALAFARNVIAYIQSQESK
ncbi:hypothetical protein [Collimonas humicola]|uniref:hypothetical protein n=1 Tax=Collimonas humicola TaxID=2825886 RepID=UPI001B8CA5D4|nr:hypothetical protein [Collimonas humicola]